MEENNYLCPENQPVMDFKAIFKRYNTNISKMAEALGMEQPNLSRSINTGAVSTKMLERMAEICDTTLEEFVGVGAVPKEIKMTINGQEYTYELKK